MSSLWRALSASVRGASHERSGQVNQDAVGLKNPSGASDYLILAVSDGHGSARSFRSARGSAIAVECAQRQLRQFVKRLGPDAPLSRVRNQARTWWPHALLAAWRTAVREDVSSNPFTFMDFAAFPDKPPVIKEGEELPINAYLAYGATLLSMVITRRYILYSQLGDGDILTVHADGGVSRPLPRNHEFQANQTISLCSYSAAQAFQIQVDSARIDAPALIMLSTDGYANCFTDDESFFKVGADFLGYLRSHGSGFVGEQLEEWLRESSQNGSGDDITVGLAARSRALESLDPHPPAAPELP